MKSNKSKINAALAAISCGALFSVSASEQQTIKLDDSLNLKMPEQVEVLEIKRPYLSFDSCIVVMVTPDEMKKLMAAYPEKIRNADSKENLTFMAEKKESR